LIKNKLMDKQNVTFTRLIIMRFGRSKDKWQKLVFMKLKEVAKYDQEIEAIKLRKFKSVSNFTCPQWQPPECFISLSLFNSPQF